MEIKHITIKICLKILLLLLFSTMSMSKSDSEMITVAISEFRTQGVSDDHEWLGKSFTDAMLTELSRSRDVRVVERDFLEEILDELELQSSALIDESSAVRVGELLGARVFIFGTLSLLNDELVVRARIVNVERGEVIGVAEATNELDNILQLQNDLALDIADQMAIEAALEDITGLEVTEVSIDVYDRLERFRNLGEDLPYFGSENEYREQSQNALMETEDIVAKTDDFEEIRYYRSLFALHAGDTRLARQELEIANRISSGNPDLILLNANIEYLSDNLNEAEELLKEYTNEVSDDARGWYALGSIYLEKRDNHEAAISFIRALQNTPYINEAKTNLRTLISGNQGLAILESVKMHKPEYYHAGKIFRAFWQDEKPDMEHVDVVLNSLPDLYLAHYMKGRNELDDVPTRARLYFRDSLNLRPDFPEAHRDLGLSYLNMNRCRTGAEHISIYVGLSRHVSDFAELQSKINSC